MIPSQVARAHCANFMSDGSCLGVYYNDDLSAKFCKPLPKCLLFGPKIERCAYFEECVMPIKIEHGGPAREKNKTDFDEGIKIYMDSALRDEKTRI